MENGILPDNPFATIDKDGVGELMRLPWKRAAGETGPGMRHLRRTRRRPQSIALVPRAGADLCLLLALPGAHRPTGGGACGYPSPGFPIYESFIRYVGALPVPLHLEESQNFTIMAGQLETLITPRTKLIIINFPSNPTGGVATQGQLEALARVIMEKCSPDVRVYSDEIYENIIFDGKAHHSIASISGMETRTIISSGFSKSFAWTGGRIGYAVLPTAEEADAFKNMNINYFSCIPPFNQAGAVEALENPASGPWMAEMTQTFEKRRDVVVNMLNKIPGMNCQTPGGAFYLFPNISGLCERLGVFDAIGRLPEDLRASTTPATLFQMFALCNHRVAVMDRRSFGAIGTESMHFLRLSIAADIESLKQGVQRLAAAGDDREGFRQFVEKGKNLY
jgi:aspartate aminotransferase